MPARVKGFARRRGALLGLVAAAALVASCAAGQTAPGPAELAQLLGTESGSVVRPEDLRWEPSGGLLADLFLGRYVLFLGSAEANGPRDVYRASIRLSPEGHPLAIGSAYNLTSTPLGDDHALVVLGRRAAFSTWSYGHEQSVTVLDLAGEGPQAAALVKAPDRAMGWGTNLQQTGSGAGVGRTDITFGEPPPARVGLALTDDALAIDAADDGNVRHGRLDLATGDITGDGMHADAAKHLPKRLVHWAVDTVRAVSFIGPAPIAWLEEKTFALKDTVRQTLFKATKSGDELVKEADQGPPPPLVLDGSQASLDTGHWPPIAIKSMWKTPDPGEGEWTLPKQTWLKTLPAVGGETPPSPFYETFVRPDEDRPYAKVILIAMDMRQLDVGMEAGSEDPKPLTGPPGTGRIPRDPAIYTRVAAAFNGGFKTEHGNYGMMLNKRVLLPPQPGAATVILTKDGRVGMGSWGRSPSLVGAIADIETADILSFRQNLDPLVDNDKVNPSNRGQWGFVLPGTSMQTERSGICVTNAGHMMYAWGDDTSATSLGKAMKMAGCIYGMHLDMNPHHTGFMYTNITEFKGKNYKSELITKEMEIDTDRYLLYAPKDFFYMMLHEPRPALEGDWEPDPGTQPAPSWMAGLWRGKTGGVELLAIEPGRASFRARAGTKDTGHSGEPHEPRHKRDRERDKDDDEPTPKASPVVLKGTELSDDDAHRVLFALSLGVSEGRHPRGLTVDGQIVIPLSGEESIGVLGISEDGTIAIGKEVPAVAKGADAVELPLVLDDGAVVPHGSVSAPVVLGTAPNGRVLVGRNASLEDIVAALKKAGCTKAVLLDRGAGNHGAISRAGTSAPPRSRYEDTTLYAVGKALLPRGFRFEPTQPVEPPAPPKKK